jgi:hypothetical protein
MDDFGLDQLSDAELNQLATHVAAASADARAQAGAEMTDAQRDEINTIEMDAQEQWLSDRQDTQGMNEPGADYEVRDDNGKPVVINWTDIGYPESEAVDAEQRGIRNKMDDTTKMGLFFMSKDGKIVTISLQDLVDRYTSGAGSTDPFDLERRTESKNDPDLFSYLGHSHWLETEDKNLRAAGIFRWGDEGTLSMLETMQAKQEGRSHILDPYKALRPASWGRYEMRPDGSYLMSYRGHRDLKLGRDYAKSKLAEKMGVSVSQVTGFDFVKKDSGKAERNGWRGSNGRTYRAAPVFEPPAPYEDLRRRLSSGPGNGSMKKADVVAVILKAFGDDAQALLDQGVLEIVDNPADSSLLTPLEAQDMRGVQGLAQDGQAALFASQFKSEREVIAIFLHEVGRHLGFGNDMRNIKQIFDDMVSRSRDKGEDTETRIAKAAVKQAIWSMLVAGRQGGQFEDAVRLLGSEFVYYAKMSFKDFETMVEDEHIDKLLKAIFEPAETGNELDDYDRRAFAAILMEETGAYVHNARARLPESELVQNLWQRILGWVRRMIYKITNGKWKPGRFTTADVEAMDRGAVKQQAKRGEANTPRDPLMDPMETRRRFSVTPEEATRATEAPAQENIKPAEDITGKMDKKADTTFRDRANELAVELQNPPEGSLKFTSTTMGSGMMTVDTEAATKPVIKDPNSKDPSAAIATLSLTYNGNPMFIKRGIQQAGETETKEKGPGSGIGGELSGFGSAHNLKHITAETARLAAVMAEQSGNTWAQEVNKLRALPIVQAQVQVAEHIVNNATHVIEYTDEKGVLRKITMIDTNSAMSVSWDVIPGTNELSLRTIITDFSDEARDRYTIDWRNKSKGHDLLERAAAFGRNNNKVPKGWKVSEPKPIDKSKIKIAEAGKKTPEDVGEQATPYGDRQSVQAELGGSVESPPPTYPPVLPPAPPGAAPVNPELSGAHKAWDIVTGRYFSGISVKAHQNASRFPGVSIQAVADIIHNRPGSQGSAAPRSIPTSIMTARGKYTNRFRDIMEPMRNHLAAMTTADREVFYEKLTDMITGRRNSHGFVGTMADNLKKLLADLHAYRIDAGEDLGAVQDYFPVVYNSDLISKNRSAFLGDAERAYRIELSKTLSGPELDSTAAASALALYNTHVRGMNDLQFGSLFEKAAPGGRENSAKERVFGRQAQNIMRAWQSNDPFLVITRYIGGAVKSAELARKFGADGSGWEAYAKGMEADGVPHEVINEMHELVCQAAGVGTVGLGSKGQAFMDTVALYTAATALGKSFMSNLFEPAAMGTRTGSPIYAIRAYGETWARSVNEFLKDRAIVGMLHQDSFWQQYGEHIGTIHNNLEDAWMTTHSMELGMDNQNPRLRWLTNRIYKANLMDATETAKQQASHALGHSYIGDLCAMIEGTHWMNKFGMDTSRSAAFDLAELGVPEADHQAFISWMKTLKGTDARQRMALLTDGSPMSKLYEEAQVRFTNQTAIRSNRAHRPVFQDNIMGKMFLQLQSFSYSYAAEANSRIYDNLKRSASSGDYTMADRMRLIAPALMLPLAVLAFGAMFELRNKLFPTEATKKHENDPWWAQFANAASYAGVFGPKVEQAMKFVMRDQPPGGVIGQEAIGAARAVKQYGVAAMADEAKQPAAYASANKAAVRAAIPPVKGALVAGAAAINPTLGTAASMLANDTTLSNQALDATKLDKPDKKREEPNPYKHRQASPKPSK